MNNVEKLESIFFPVQKISSASICPGYSFAGAKAVSIVREDTKKVLHVCSNDYNLSTNESLVMPVFEKLTNLFGQDMIEVKIKTVDECKFYITLIVNNKPFNVQKGDVVCPSVELTNSYNGLLKRGISVGYHRVVCSNGMMAFMKAATLSSKHTKAENNFKLLDSLLEKTDSQLKRFERLAERRMTPRELEQLTDLIRNNTEFPKSLLEEVPEVIAREQNLLDVPLTAWLSYHGFNNILNHGDFKMHPEFRAKIDVQVLKEVELLLN